MSKAEMGLKRAVLGEELVTAKAAGMSAEESRAWLALVQLSHALPHALDAQLQRDSELTHFEFMVLSNLFSSQDYILQMTDLAKLVSATLPRLSHVCTRMQKRQLLNRVQNEADRRITDVSLTDLGRRVFIRALPAHIALVRATVLDALSDTQLIALAEIGETINAQLAKQSEL